MEKNTELVDPPPPPYQPKEPEYAGTAPKQKVWVNQYGEQPTNVAGQTHVVIAGQAKSNEFGTQPVFTTCTNCRQPVKTVVRDKIKQGGWMWCILCSLCYSWIVGLLACCMNGFK